MLPASRAFRRVSIESAFPMSRSDSIAAFRRRLRERLQDGRIAAAAFDVFAQEPPTDAALVGLPNFIATPHIGGSAVEAVLAMGRAAIAGLDTATDPLSHIQPWEE